MSNQNKVIQNNIFFKDMAANILMINYKYLFFIHPYPGFLHNIKYYKWNQ